MEDHRGRGPAHRHGGRSLTVPVTITKKMGQSVIGQGDVCLKRIEYDWFHDTPILGGVNRSIGTGYHAGNAEGYLQRMHGNPVDVDRMVEAAVHTFYASIEFDEYTQKPVDQFDWTYQPSTYRAPQIVLMPEQAAVVVEQLVRAYWAGNQWSDDYQTVAVEFSMDMDYPGAPEGWRRGGTVDLILARDGQYILDDHKTARKAWAKNKGTPTNPQAAWYVDMWRHHSGSTNVTFAYDVMAINLNPEDKMAYPSFERRLAPRTTEQIEATLEKGRMLAQLIDQGGPFLPSPDSFLCSPHYCDHWKRCPFGSTLNLEAA